jgi:thiosulfate/3-mercaptopyruvate sulfurtransferase
MADTATSALVSPDWLEAHLGDPKLRLIEIAGLGQEDMAAYRTGHIPGAVCWLWKEMLWDDRIRDFPTPDEFARRIGDAGIGNDTTVVFCGEGVQFGVYAWWVFRYCGHADVRVLDGARYRWRAEGRRITTDVPPAPAAKAYSPTARRQEMRIYRDEVAAALGKDDVAILDARSPEE